MGLKVMLVHNGRRAPGGVPGGVPGGAPEGAPATVEALLAAEGYVVVDCCDGDEDVLERARHCRPDVVVVDVPTPQRRLLAKIESLQRTAPRPVAMFCDDSDSRQVGIAVAAGVNALAAACDSRRRMGPTIDLAVAQFKETDRLRRDCARAETALKERKAVDRAKGILMKQRGLDEDAAYGFMRRTAMSRNVRIGQLATSIIEAEELLG